MRSVSTIVLAVCAPLTPVLKPNSGFSSRTLPDCGSFSSGFRNNLALIQAASNDRQNHESWEATIMNGLSSPPQIAHSASPAITKMVWPGR